MLNNQSIKSHPGYPEYVQMRIRERKLLQTQEELREECKDRSDFKEACRKMTSAGKKLDMYEKILREETA